MSGIAGFISRIPCEQVERELLCTGEALHQENFCGIGTWVEESLRVCVGWIVQRGFIFDGVSLRNSSREVSAGHTLNESGWRKWFAATSRVTGPPPPKSRWC